MAIKEREARWKDLQRQMQAIQGEIKSEGQVEKTATSGNLARTSVVLISGRIADESVVATISVPHGSPCLNPVA